jgi:hypothetical protein
MKAIIEYNLPDEESEFRTAMNGQKYQSCLWEMDQWLRSKLKYDDNLTQEQFDIYQLVREKLREIINEHTVSLDD